MGFVVAISMDWFRCLCPRFAYILPKWFLRSCAVALIPVFFETVRSQRAILLSMVLSTFTSLLHSGTRPLGAWAYASRVCHTVNVTHCELVISFFTRLAMGDEPLLACVTVALVWTVFIIASSFSAAAFLYATTVYPMERLLLSCAALLVRGSAD